VQGLLQVNDELRKAFECQQISAGPLGMAAMTETLGVAQL